MPNFFEIVLNAIFFSINNDAGQHYLLIMVLVGIFSWITDTNMRRKTGLR